MSKQEKTELRNFKEEILEYIQNNPTGLTITDIAKGINSTRITVSKYVSTLEAEKKITYTRIGAYKLYYCVKRTVIPVKIASSFYIGFLSSLKKEFSNKEKFKEFGTNIANFMEFPYGSKAPENVKPTRKGNTKKFLDYISKLFPYIDFIHEHKLDVETSINDDGNKATYYLKNIELLEISKDFDVHFYIESGVIEASISKVINRKCICNVEKIDITNKSVILTIEII